MTRTARNLAVGVAAALGAALVIASPVSAAPVGPVTVTPATGAATATSIFETSMVCKASDTVSVIVSGGTGTGASVPVPGKVMVKPVPVASVATAGGGMAIPGTQSWEKWATTGDPVLTRIDGDYLVTVQCTNGESYASTVRFIGTNVTDATYQLVVPTPTTATATATATKTATATATKTATATTTAPEKPIALPQNPPAANGPLTITGTPLAGSTITVTGEGFRPGSPLTVGLYPGAQQVGSAVADAAGKGTTQLQIPKGMKGEYELVMLGYAPDGKERAVTAKATVIDAPAVTIPPALPKTDGALTVEGATIAGGTVTVSGSGFKPGTPVAVGIYSDGKPLTTAVADQQGKASTPVILPADYTGAHTLAMLGANPQETLRTLTSEVMIEAAPVPSSGLPWWLWLLIALVIVLVIAIVWILVARRKPSPWDTSLTGQATAAQRLAEVTAPAIADRARPANECIALWNAELPQMQAAELQVAQLAQAAPDDTRRANAQRLLGSAIALRESLQTDVQLRAAPDTVDAALAQSAAVVAQRRQELLTVTASLSSAAGGAHR